MRRPRGFLLGLGRMMGGRSKSRTPLERALDRCGMGQLASIATHMYWPAESSRQSGTRHYVYLDVGGWTETTVSGTVLETGEITGGTGRVSWAAPAGCAYLLKMFWYDGGSEWLMAEFGFSRALTTLERAGFDDDAIAALIPASVENPDPLFYRAVGMACTETGPAYFCDSVGGDDGNPGTKAEPFQTVAALLAADASANRAYHYFRSGSEWPEEYDCPDRAGLTVAAYDCGVLPKFKGSDPIAAGSWSKTDGQTNVYQITVSDMLATSGSVRVWEDNATLPISASLAACDAAPGSFYVSTHDGPTTIYVHATGSGNPTTNGKAYEHTGHREYCINPNTGELNARTWTMRGLHLNRNYSNNGVAFILWDWNVIGCRFDDGTKHNLVHKPGCTFTDCLFDRGYWSADGGGSTICTMHDTTTDVTRGVTYKRCVTHGDPTYSSLAYLAHVGLAGDELGWVIYDECTIENCGQVIFPGGQVRLVRISNCRCDEAEAIAATSPVTECDLEILGGDFTVRGAGSTGAVIMWDNNHSTDVIMRGVTIRYAITVQNLISAGRDLEMTNCTVVPAADGSRDSVAILAGIGGSVTANMSGNYFDTSRTVFANWSTSPNVTSNNNTFKGPVSSSQLFNLGGTEMGLAAYRAATGQEADSVVA